MFTNKSFNSLEVKDQEESLNFIIEEISRIDKMSFDTWYQSITRFIAKFIAKFMLTIKFSKDIVYEVNDETDIVCVHTVLTNRTVTAIMPKNLLIESEIV